MSTRHPLRLAMGLGVTAAVLLIVLSMSALSSAPAAVQPAAATSPGSANLIWLPNICVGATRWPHFDLGDAPDSTNTVGPAMTVYPIGGPSGTVADFPTVFATGSPPYGPRHHDATARYWLGQAVSIEREADTGFDADGVNNLVPELDRPDLDKADDGVNPNPVLPHCQRTQLDFTVTVPPGAPAGQAYVNLWFDWDRSGRWGELSDCPGATANEWAVPNQVIALPGPGTYRFQTRAFYPYNPNPSQCLWWRITLSDSFATNNDGRGPANGYRFGETEDYYSCG